VIERRGFGHMKILSEAAKGISEFLWEQGYTEEHLHRLELAGSSPNDNLSSTAQLVTNDGDLLDLLIRLFFVGEPVSIRQGERFLPKAILRSFLTLGLLEGHADQLQPACRLTYFGKLIVACDSRPRTQTCPSDLVLDVNPTTRLLGNCSMLRAGERALDLGTGCGALALAAASSAESVIGTDINQRALDFCEINAALNGVRNVSFLQGDRFEPVAGSRFDVIISNPPFFVVPVSGMVCCDNMLDLDGFVESLARRAPEFLEENGIFQMLCEWVEFASEPWQERVTSWFEESQCDIHIWQGYEFSPSQYARQRALEQSQFDPEAAWTASGERISHLRERQVKSIFGGLISMRRRPGKNWFWVEEMQKRPTGPIGDALRDRFSTRDILELNSEQALLATRPKLAPGVRLVSEAAPQNGAWTIKRSYLERTDDLPAKIGLDAVVAQFAARLDGTEVLERLLMQLALEQKVSLDRVIPEGLRVIKQLGEKGLILFEQG
jgi:Methyltransferase small domain